MNLFAITVSSLVCILLRMEILVNAAKLSKMTKYEKMDILTSSWIPSATSSSLRHEMQCSSICSTSTNCSAYIYDFNDQSCQLGNVRTTSQAVSGSIKVNAQKLCYYQNYDSLGYDISNGPASSTSQCQKICQDTMGCNYFAFSNGICYLKSVIGDRSEKPGFTSGPKFCDVCYYYDMDFSGNDLSNVYTSNVFDCQQKCQQNSQCLFFTRNIYGTCILKTSPGLMTPSVVGAVSGPKYCGGCFQPSYNMPQNDITSVSNIGDPFQCQMLCQVTSGCNFFALSGSACWLKTSSATKKIERGTTVGPKFC